MTTTANFACTTAKNCLTLGPDAVYWFEGADRGLPGAQLMRLDKTAAVARSIAIVSALDKDPGGVVAQGNDLWWTTTDRSGGHPPTSTLWHASPTGAGVVAIDKSVDHGLADVAGFGGEVFATRAIDTQQFTDQTFNPNGQAGDGVLHADATRALGVTTVGSRTFHPLRLEVDAEAVYLVGNAGIVRIVRPLLR